MKVNDTPENKTLSEKAMGAFSRIKDAFGGVGRMFDKKKEVEPIDENKKELFTTLSSDQVSPLRKGETVSNIATKIYSLVGKEGKEELKEYKSEKEELRQFEKLKEKRHKEIINALLGKGKFKSKIKEPKLEVPKIEKPKVPSKPPVPPTPTPAPRVPTPPPPAPRVPTPTPAPRVPAPTPPAPRVPTPPPPAPRVPTPPPPTPGRPPAPKVERAPKVEPTKPTLPLPKLGTPSGNKAALIASLTAAGYSEIARANILANVQEESNFIPRSEELEKYSAKTLYRLYGPLGVSGGQPSNGKNKVRFQTLDEAQNVVNQGPEAVGDVIYGGRLGNNQTGDGYKYRGRGFIQITGKENYEKIGKVIGIDLVNNPDLANQPDIAAKIIPAYLSMKIKKPEDLENIEKINIAVGSASEKSKEKRKKLAEQYKSELSSGDNLSDASIQNATMKNNLNGQQSPVIVNNNTNINSIDNTVTTPMQANDDSSPYINRNKR
jgi:predicted chitinase